MTFDPTLNPGARTDAQTPQPSIDRHLDAVYHALTQDLPVAIDDLRAAARAAGTLFGNGADDAISRIVGRLADLDARSRSDVVYLHRAIDEQHARLLTDLDGTRRLLDATVAELHDTRGELERATVDATTRLLALQSVRRDLTDVATFARQDAASAAAAATVDWFAVVDRAVATIDGATIEEAAANPDAAADHRLQPRTVIVDPGDTATVAADAGVPIYPDVIATDPGRWADPGDTAAGS